MNSTIKEKKITNISDLKKSTLRVKLPKILGGKINPENIKEELQKYCRTCAEQKVPLIDVFSEKGIQMKLNNQIEHLQKLTESDNSSTSLCMDCICDLRVSHVFFLQIKKAESKLNLIYNSLNEDISDKKTTKKKEVNSCSNISENMPEIHNDLDVTESMIPEEVNISNNEEVNEVINESIDGYCDFNLQNEDVESIEDFDPDDPFVNTNPIKDGKKELVFKQSKKETMGKNNKEEIPNSESTEILDKDENKISGDQNETLILKKNLKRKNSETAKENLVSNDAIKINPKIQKIDIQNPVNIKTEEDGVMYVTVKGSKPNEMLLIKVKKVDKLNVKKKVDSPEKKNELFDSYYKLGNGKGDIIEQQIEQYKKKREEVLGGSTKNFKTTSRVLEPKLPKIISCSSEGFKSLDNEKAPNISEKQENKNFRISNGMPTLTPPNSLGTEKMNSRFKEIKRKHDDINKDLSQDTFAKLKSILKLDDESVKQFQNYLKLRRIVVSRLKDDDIIQLYELKNNVVIERSQVEIKQEVIEDVDPFAEKELYPCNFCFQIYLSKEMEIEHSKIHDFKIIFSCDDCGQKFSTNKARKNHNVDCSKKLICKYCGEQSESKGKKRQHEQKHCDEEHGQLCDTCGEKLKNQTTLDQHIKSKHMDLEKIFECPKCLKKFAFKTKLSFHLRTVHITSRPYLCEDCGDDFKNPASLRHHRMRRHQTTNNKKECKVCKKIVPAYSLSKHMHTHKDYTIKCPHCEKMFKNSSTLRQHTRIHEDQRQYKCDMCGVGFNRRDGLKLHLKVHSKTDSKALKECSCQLCGEKFPNHSMLVLHRNRTHKDGRNFTCFICNRSMISQKSLEWHLAHIHNQTISGSQDGSSSEVTIKRVSCLHCSKTFKTEMILRTHVKNTHTEKEAVKCPDCSLLYTSEVRLRHHMMVEHGHLEGTLKCPHCPKRFVNGLRLKTHMIAHSDERPYSCDICGFTLKTKIQLVKHHQNRHSDERPLQCKYCTWKCKQVSALVCHERTHTNERPYTCSVCNQRFKYLGDKNKHERRHESMGGNGFKRLVPGKINQSYKQKKDELQNEEYNMQNDFHEQTIEEEIDPFEEEEGQNIKFEKDIDIDETDVEAEAAYEQMYIEEVENNTNNGTSIILGMEEGAMYTEEVTTDDIEPEIITNDIIDEEILQPGTVVHLQQEDENGKIQMIPVLFSIPELTDGNNDGNLTNESVMYNS